MNTITKKLSNRPLESRERRASRRAERRRASAPRHWAANPPDPPELNHESATHTGDKTMNEDQEKRTRKMIEGQAAETLGARFEACVDQYLAELFQSEGPDLRFPSWPEHRQKVMAKSREAAREVASVLLEDLITVAHGEDSLPALRNPIALAALAPKKPRKG